MRVIILSLLLSLTCSLAIAQKAKVTQAKLLKKTYTAVQIEFEQSEQLVKTILAQRLKKDNVNFYEKKHGFDAKEIKYTRLSQSLMDLYIELETTPTGCIVNIFMLKGEMPIISEGNAEANNAKLFLESCIPEFAEYNYQQAVLQQENIVKKAQDHVTALEKEKLELEQALERNRVNLLNGRTDLKNQQLLLQQKKKR